MDNPEKPITHGTQDEAKQKQHNYCWTPLYENKHKQGKQDMSPPTNNCR